MYIGIPSNEQLISLFKHVRSCSSLDPIPLKLINHSAPPRYLLYLANTIHISYATHLMHNFTIIKHCLN